MYPPPFWPALGQPEAAIHANYFSLKTIDRIVQFFGLGAELLQFKSD
jgi:hypothetical protein